MPVTNRYYRLRIRDALDTADALTITSVPTGTNPYITEPPSGDGQSFDPITGAVTTGSYTIRIADAETATDTRVFTSQIADARARQQYIARRAYVDSSADAAAWANMIPGYVTAYRLISGIEWEVAIGQTRRKEVSRELFRQETAEFDGVSSVIGGPVRGGFANLLEDHGGWRFKATQVNTAPAYIQIKIVTGFDPRKYTFAPSFSTTSQAITDYTNNWARPYFEASETWLAASTPIRGHFPGLRVRLEPITVPADPVRLFTPLSEPDGTAGPWWSNVAVDNLTRSGESSLWIPVDGLEEDGTPIVGFSPAINDEFDVYVYAVPISDQNPLHWYGHLVDLWESVQIEIGNVAGEDYDDSNLAALKALLGENLYVALRITKSYKPADFLQQVVYGPGRLSSRVENGLLTLFSMRVAGTPAPTTVVTIDDLRSDGGTVFDVDESTVVTAVTLKQQRLVPWTSDDPDQPEIDALTSRPWPVQTIENADDDIPAGLADSGRDATVGDIPGTIVRNNADPDLIEPEPFEQYLAGIATEIFDRFGRGAIAGDMEWLPDITEQIGEEVILNLVHRPNALAGQSPVSRRGGERRVQIVQRTERPEGSDVRVVDSALEIEGGVDTGVGGGTEEEDDPTGITPVAPTAFASADGATANWVDSYPQFSTLIQWEAHPPSDATFYLLYGGEVNIIVGVFTHFMPITGIGYVVRCRYRLYNSSFFSNWSAFSNEVTIPSGSPPETPTDVPTNLVATSTVTDEAHAAWVNTSAILQIRINWQASVESPGPPTVWGNVAGGNRLLAAADTADDQPTGAGTFARFRLAYVNSVGTAGPYTDWSAYVAITP